MNETEVVGLKMSVQGGGASVQQFVFIDYLRALAAWALGEIEDAQAVEPLVGALKDSDEDVRATAAWALGEIGSPRARDGLTAAERDEVGSVRRAATWALRQIDDNDDVQVHVRPHVKVKP